MNAQELARYKELKDKITNKKTELEEQKTPRVPSPVTAPARSILKSPEDRKRS